MVEESLLHWSPGGRGDRRIGAENRALQEQVADLQQLVGKKEVQIKFLKTPGYWNTSRRSSPAWSAPYHGAASARGLCSQQKGRRSPDARTEAACKVKKSFVVTTNSRHAFERYPNLYANNILSTLNYVLFADITYIRLRNGHAYLAVILDAFSCRIIGWYLSRTSDASLSLSALQMAISTRQPHAGVIHHSDRACSSAVVPTPIR